MRTFALPLLVACSGAPSGDDSGHDPYPDKECGNGLWGSSFVSQEALECGLGPEGDEVSCNWALVFGDGVFTWAHSDVTEEGTVTCEDTALTGVSAGGETINGTFHRTTARVTWDGDVYDEIE